MTKNALHLAPGLNLDPDYIGGGTLGVIAKRGAGKTYLGRVLAEEFWQAGVPFVVLDPMGMWWGLRSSADGKSTGIPVAIFGGDHGDAPLERTSGAVLADLVIDEGLSAILDMSALGSRAAERQFALDFLDRLYRRHGATGRLLHILMDEADLFAPQKPQAGDQPLLGATENIVRRGRNRGIAITLITQRSAVLNKDVLTQVDGLIAGRVLSPQDRDAVDAWTKVHGDPDTAATLRGSLHELDTGEWWFWIPELDVLKRVKVRRSRTFDCSPTRRRSGQRAEPKTFADVDMAAIQARMAATIERAQSEDPKTLRRRIKELTAALEERPDPARVEVPVLTDDARDALNRAVTSIDEAQQTMVDAVADAVQKLSGVLDQLGAKVAAAPPSPASRTQPSRVRPAAALPTRVAPPPDHDGFLRVQPAQQRILNALASLAAIGVAAPTKTQLALFAEASPKSSGYSNNLGALRSAGLIDYPAPGTAALTAAGCEQADAAGAPGTVEEMHDYVQRLVGPARWRILAQLIAAYPDALPKTELAERAGASSSSSGYSNNLGSLRSLGLIDYPAPGHVAALPVLFFEGAR